MKSIHLHEKPRYPVLMSPPFSLGLCDELALGTTEDRGGSSRGYPRRTPDARLLRRPRCRERLNAGDHGGAQPGFRNLRAPGRYPLAGGDATHRPRGRGPGRPPPAQPAGVAA